MLLLCLKSISMFPIVNLLYGPSLMYVQCAVTCVESPNWFMILEDEHISDVLCGRNIGLPADVVETITSATKQHASNILNQLRELQVDLRSNPAIFVGGGSILLRPFLEDSPMVMRGSFVDSPNANAVGYEMLGRTQMLRPNA